MSGPRNRQAFLAAVAGVCLVCGAARGADMWQVEQAPLRFDVIVYSDPSEPSAGVIATLPDGGLLPRPVPVPSVYTPDGQSLECRVLWHNPAVGLALVFQPPPGGRRSPSSGARAT